MIDKNQEVWAPEYLEILDYNDYVYRKRLSDARESFINSPVPHSDPQIKCLQDFLKKTI